MKNQMEHPIRKTPFFDFNHKESETVNSETPMIIREMLIYNRQLVEENAMLTSQVKSLEMEIQRILTANEFKLPNYEKNPSPPSFDEFEFPSISSVLVPENENIEIVDEIPKKRALRKKGTQVCIDPAIATMFARQLKDSGYRLADVARAMMLIAIERPRYRNMILDRIKQSERIANTERECTSFAFTYPVDLGENFNALLRSHKIKQYEFFEQMFKEFVQSYSFRKLLPDYIHHVKHKNKI